MDVFFPIFSCILVSSVVACYCVKHHRRQRQRQLQPFDETMYVVIPRQQPKPSAPPITYDSQDGDPIV